MRPILDLTPEMSLAAVLERDIAKALADRKRIRAMGFVRVYRRGRRPA